MIAFGDAQIKKQIKKEEAFKYLKNGSGVKFIEDEKWKLKY